jgi:hypothetical protein
MIMGFIRRVLQGIGNFILRLRSGFGVPKYEREEVFQLGKHVLSRLKKIKITSGGSTDDESRLDDWVACRFTYPLRALIFQSSRNSRGQVLLSLIVIGLGFATSGIAVAHGGGTISSTTSWTVFAFGLIVALAGGLSQLFRPGYRASQTISLVIQFREEGWAFANMTGAYVTGDDKAFNTFDKSISTILKQAAQVRTLEALPAKGAASKA